MKNEKGITLIALIITIIVMLILVGVTITIVIQSGLFEQAKSASGGMQGEMEREELYSVAVGLYDVDSGINQTALAEKIANLGTEYTVDNERTVANSKYVVSGPSGKIWQINLSTAEVKEYKEEKTVYYVNENIGMILVINYADNSGVFYMENDGNYEMDPTGKWSFTLPNEFTVYLDGNIETEQDGGKVFYNTNSGQTIIYTKDNTKLYIITDEENGITKFNSSVYVTLDEDFDTTLLND